MDSQGAQAGQASHPQPSLGCLVGPRATWTAWDPGTKGLKLGPSRDRQWGWNAIDMEVGLPDSLRAVTTSKSAGLPTPTASTSAPERDGGGRPAPTHDCGGKLRHGGREGGLTPLTASGSSTTGPDLCSVGGQRGGATQVGPFRWAEAASAGLRQEEGRKPVNSNPNSCQAFREKCGSKTKEGN